MITRYTALQLATRHAVLFTYGTALALSIALAQGKAQQLEATRDKLAGVTARSGGAGRSQ